LFQRGFVEQQFSCLVPLAQYRWQDKHGAGKTAVEVHFHVAGAFKLFINQVAIRLPVSTRQVARIVRLPPSAVLRAHRKALQDAVRRIDTPERFCRWKALPGYRHGSNGNTVQQDDHIHATFHDAFGSFQASSATRVWFSTGSSKVAATTSP